MVERRRQIWNQDNFLDFMTWSQLVFGTEIWHALTKFRKHFFEIQFLHKSDELVDEIFQTRMVCTYVHAFQISCPNSALSLGTCFARAKLHRHNRFPPKHISPGYDLRM